MKKQNNKNVEINFSTEVLTKEQAGQIFIAIYELLLYQRNSIPFVYQTFKYLTSRLPQIDDEETNIHFDAQRQISQARKTLEDINNHFKV